MSQHADMDRLQKAKQLQAQNKEDEAFSIFKELAEHGNAEAQCVLGEAFEKSAEETICRDPLLVSRGFTAILKGNRTK